MTIYRYADERIECDRELPLVPTVDDDAAVDALVVVRHADAIESPAFSELLHRGDLDGSPWALGVLADGSGWGAVFGPGCVMRLGNDTSRVELTALPSAPAEWLADAIVAWALVYRLAVRGRPAFHASAATVDGKRAVAICGPTLSGKSTMAAAALAVGGSLLADDVVVPFVSGDRVMVSSTASAVRLRGVARSLSRSDDTTVTFDGRLSVPAIAPTDALPLARLVFLDPTAGPDLRPLRPDEVAVRLLAESKVGAWAWQDARDREFEVACSIADRVPGFVIGRRSGAASVAHLTAACDRVFAD
jgi:hypothetical protein